MNALTIATRHSSENCGRQVARVVAVLTGMMLIVAMALPIAAAEVGIRAFICLFPLLLWLLTRRCFPRTALFFRFVTLLAAAGYLSCAFIFAVATTARPLADASLARCDSFLGLSAATLIEHVNEYPVLTKALTIIYASALLQTIFGLAYLAYCRQERRLHLYVVRFIFCAMLTAVGFWLLPADGTCVTYRLPIPDYYAATLEQLHHLRSGWFSLEGPAGIVTFPSFHCIAAVLTASMFHRSRLFLPFAILNALVVVSALTVGFHYFIDVFGGLLVAFGMIALVPVDTTNEADAQRATRKSRRSRADRDRFATTIRRASSWLQADLPLRVAQSPRLHYGSADRYAATASEHLVTN
jgi:membrane-associated phospholipid phosphatase